RQWYICDRLKPPVSVAGLVHQKPDSSVKFIRPCSEPVGKNPNPRNRSAGATSISSFPLLMEPIVVAVGCGAAGAASDLKINPPRLIKKGLWEQRYARVLRQRRPSARPYPSPAFPSGMTGPLSIPVTG